MAWAKFAIMNIHFEGRPTAYSKIIGRVNTGHPVQFKHRFHTDYGENDIFIRIVAPSSYISDEVEFSSKGAVINLKTGRLSIIDRNRECRLIKARVQVMEEHARTY